ncbi:MAG: AAA family ATPase [Candidatus Hydrothermarchaeales archaeon]
MIIEEVGIKNFRSHKDTRLQFDQGISVIVGNNGSGKTSILDAINFALFKQKPNREISVDDLIRRGAEETKVSVTFYSNERIFRVTRGRRGRKATGSAIYQIEDGEEIILAEGEDEVTREVERILNINGELFISAIYIKQGEIDSLLSATPSVRKEHIGKLLGAQDLENAYKNMRELIGEYSLKIEGLKSVPKNIEKTEGAIEGEKSEVAKLRDEIRRIDEKLTTKKRDFEEIEKKIGLLERLKDLENIKKGNYIEMRGLSEKIEKISTYEKDLKKTEGIHRRYTNLEREIDSLKEEKSRLAKYVERDTQLKKELLLQEEKVSELNKFILDAFGECGLLLNTRIESYDQLETLYSEKMEDIESGLVKIKREKEEVSSRIGKLQGNNEEIRRAIKELEGAEDRCPVCSAKLTPEHKRELLMGYSENVKKNMKEISGLEERLKAWTKEEFESETLKQKIRGINLGVIKSRIDEKTKIEGLNSEIKDAIDENKKSLKDLAGLEKTLKEKEAGKGELKEGNERYIEAKLFLRKNLPEKESFQRQIDKLKAGIERIKREIEDIAREIGYRPDIDVELGNLKREKRPLLDELTELEKEKSGAESVVKEKNRLIENLKKELEELKGKERELGRLKDFKIFLEKIRALFHKDALQKDLRARAKPLVERYAGEVFDRFELPYSDIALTDDFSMVLYGPQGEEGVDMLSGGERIASALALRIGIAKALSGSTMELIMLDEPTIHLDATRRQDLVEIIKRLSSIPQTIVVTHDKEFEGAADTLIEVEKIEGVSKVTYAE